MFFLFFPLPSFSFFFFSFFSFSFSSPHTLCCVGRVCNLLRLDCSLAISALFASHQ
uniref:Secreted protein n=1 Tax=Anguilla anguilla TaxID=7936 RepID=A0A0E9UMA5_ANGAN